MILLVLHYRFTKFGKLMQHPCLVPTCMGWLNCEFRAELISFSSGSVEASHFCWAQLYPAAFQYDTFSHAVTILLANAFVALEMCCIEKPFLLGMLTCCGKLTEEPYYYFLVLYFSWFSLLCLQRCLKKVIPRSRRRCRNINSCIVKVDIVNSTLGDSVQLVSITSQLCNPGPAA